MKRIFPKGTSPEQIAKAVITLFSSLDPKKSWSIEVVEWRKPRTEQQNRFLWGVVYPCILENGGEALSGWQRDDLHEYFLGECFGMGDATGIRAQAFAPAQTELSAE
jgi:hypothetical protein